MARKHDIHLQVLVLDSDVVCFACFHFALVKSASVQGEGLMDAGRVCMLSQETWLIALFATLRMCVLVCCNKK